MALGMKTDQLGERDPCASKACAELMTSAYYTFFEDGAYSLLR